jgi:asparaginyl-tRNA synthetase
MVDKTAIERLQHVASTPFKRLTYSDAIEILEGVVRDGKKKFEFPVRAGADRCKTLLADERCRCSPTPRSSG